MQIKCPTAGHDGITGTRFRLPPETTEKPDKTFKTCQAVKGGKPYQAQLTVWGEFPVPGQAKQTCRLLGIGDSVMCLKSPEGARVCVTALQRGDSNW